jgi:hypothetical protein
MTSRKPRSQLLKIQPPNPANIARKLFRIRQEIVAITISIDEALAVLANKSATENEAS